MAEEEMREWMTEIIQRYWINEKKLEELDKEMGACRRKQQFWERVKRDLCESLIDFFRSRIVR